MNKLFAVSGVSGSGKTTTMRQVMNNEIISFTTRSPRKGEIDGEDYIFTNAEEINYLDSIGGLIERAEYAGNFYGITSNEFESKLNKGDAFVIVNYHGYQQIKEIYPSVIGIYFKINKEEVEQRMRERGDSEEAIVNRTQALDEEMSVMTDYEYIVENIYGKQNETVKVVKEIVNGVI